MDFLAAFVCGRGAAFFAAFALSLAANFCLHCRGPLLKIQVSIMRSVHYVQR